MIFEEYKQTSTAPLRYILLLNPKELEKVKDLVFQIIERIKKDEEN